MMKALSAMFFCLYLTTQVVQGQSVDPFAAPDDDFFTSYRRAYLEQETGLRLGAEANLLLYDTIAGWLGTPYKYAGGNENGIDCSGFVNILFDRVYGIYLGARNSGAIFTRVDKIERDELKEGDLVFFRITQRRISHVGLYLGENKFVHASTRSGVIISDLNEPYYRRYYAGGGRIKDRMEGMTGQRD